MVGNIILSNDEIFVIGFGKSGKTSDGNLSDYFIGNYEKVPENPGSLRLAANYVRSDSDKICQI